MHSTKRKSLAQTNTNASQAASCMEAKAGEAFAGGET
jgi:hypothetical protein